MKPWEEDYDKEQTLLAFIPERLAAQLLSLAGEDYIQHTYPEVAATVRSLATTSGQPGHELLRELNTQLTEMSADEYVLDQDGMPELLAEPRSWRIPPVMNYDGDPQMVVSVSKGQLPSLGGLSQQEATIYLEDFAASLTATDLREVVIAEMIWSKAFALQAFNDLGIRSQTWGALTPVVNFIWDYELAHPNGPALADEGRWGHLITERIDHWRQALQTSDGHHLLANPSTWQTEPDYLDAQGPVKAWSPAAFLRGEFTHVPDVESPDSQQALRSNLHKADAAITTLQAKLARLVSLPTALSVVRPEWAASKLQETKHDDIIYQRSMRIWAHLTQSPHIDGPTNADLATLLPDLLPDTPSDATLDALRHDPRAATQAAMDNHGMKPEDYKKVAADQLKVHLPTVTLLAPEGAITPRPHAPSLAFKPLAPTQWIPNPSHTIS